MSDQAAVIKGKVHHTGGNGAKIAPAYPAARLLKGAVFDAQQALVEAKQVLETAQQEAAAIRQTAQAEVDSVRKAAFAHGAEEAMADFAQTLKKLDVEIERVKQRFAAEVTRVAFRFAKAILDVEFAARPERVTELVIALLKPARLYSQVTVHLNPADLERVKVNEQRLLKQLAVAREIHFNEDPDLPAHGVRIETEMGTYDGTIETQLRRLQQHVMGDKPIRDT